jgi:intein/homing endonuclease
MNEKLYELIGAYIGDGYLSRKYGKKQTFTFGIAGHAVDDLEYLQYLQRILKTELPESNPKIWFKKNEQTAHLKVYSKKVHSFFLKLGFKAGIKTKIVKIPEELLESEYIPLIMRGIFDTDSCVFLDKRKAYKKPYPRITLQMCSGLLMNQIYDYLSSFLIVYYIRRKVIINFIH